MTSVLHAARRRFTTEYQSVTGLSGRLTWRTRRLNRTTGLCGSICPPLSRSLRADRRLKLEFHGSKVTSDAELLAQRLLQEDQVRKEIEERRLYEEWKKQRLGS